MSQGSKVNVNVGDDESTTIQSLFVEYQYTLLQNRASDFARSWTREIQVFPRNPAKFPQKREIPRNPPEIFPNTCRQNIFNTYLGY